MAGLQKSRRNTEDAFAAVVVALGSTALNALDVAKGLDVSRFLEKDRLQITAGDSEMESIGGIITGNVMVKLGVAVVTHHKESSRSNHGDLAADLEDVAFRDDLIAQMNTLGPADYSVQTTRNDVGQSTGRPMRSSDRINGGEIWTVVEFEFTTLAED